jgi:hypothetical protein
VIRRCFRLRDVLRDVVMHARCPDDL